MRTIRLITEGAAARWPVVKNTKAEAFGAVKKLPTKVLIKSSSLCKCLIKTMNENRNVTLFLVLCLVMRRKLIRRRDQKLLEIGASDLTPILDVCQRLLVADPVCNAIEIDVRSDATLAPIIDHPILRHVMHRLG